MTSWVRSGLASWLWTTTPGRVSCDTRRSAPPPTGSQGFSMRRRSPRCLQACSGGESFRWKGATFSAPEPLLRPLRDATYDDFLIAVDHGNEAARKSLAELFPAYVLRAAASVGKRE